MSFLRSLAGACLLIIATATSAPARADAPPPATDPSTVVASQGGVTVTFGDIDAFAQRMAPKERPVFFNNPKRLETLITNLLLQKQLANEAEKEGLGNDPLVKAQIELASDDVLAKARMEKLRDSVKVPSMATLAKEDYVGHKEKYVTPGKLEVRQILISTTAHSDEEARTIANTVEKEAKAAPDQFGALVQKYSDEPNKDTSHGLITDARTTRYSPAFTAAANALTLPGEISPVIKTKYGYQILQLVARTSDVQLPFKDVSESITERLKAEYIEKKVSAHTDELRNQKVDANADLVASLRDRFGVAPSLPGTDVPPTP
ncbi:MAG: peptidylprolyl isomerase [Rhodanobacteraceae bacterium]